MPAMTWTWTGVGTKPMNRTRILSYPSACLVQLLQQSTGKEKERLERGQPRTDARVKELATGLSCTMSGLTV